MSDIISTQQTYELMTKVQRAYGLLADNVEGIGDTDDASYFAALTWCRLTFLCFLQQKQFLNGNAHYLVDSWQRGLSKAGLYGFFSQLFQVAARPSSKRSRNELAEYGTIPYLPVALFDRHEIENKWPKCGVADPAFGRFLESAFETKWVLDDDFHEAADQDTLTPRLLSRFKPRSPHIAAEGNYLPDEIARHLCNSTIPTLFLTRLVPELDYGNAGIPPQWILKGMLAEPDRDTSLDLLQDTLTKIRILDPNCGNREILVEASYCLLSILEILFRSYLPRRTKLELKLDMVKENLFGVDQDRINVLLTTWQLYLLLAASCNSAEDFDRFSEIRPNIVCGNPLVGYTTLVPSESIFLVTTEQEDDIADRQLLNLFRKMRIGSYQVAWDSQERREGKPTRRTLTQEDLQKLQPLHWADAFPEAILNGGFDVILTLPPWKQVRSFDERDFVFKHVAGGKANYPSRSKLQTLLANLLDLPELVTKWQEAKSTFLLSAAYYKAEYGSVNLADCFIYRLIQLLRNGGKIAVCVPAGLLANLESYALRRALLEGNLFEQVLEFSNSRNGYIDIHPSFRFILLTLTNSGNVGGKGFRAAFDLSDLGILDRFPIGSNCVSLNKDLIKRLSPRSLAILGLSDPVEYHLLDKLLRFPSLEDEIESEQQPLFSAELQMANDSQLFHTKPCENCLPLYEGRMIYQFVHDRAEPRYWIEKAEGRSEVLGRHAEDIRQKVDFETYRLAIRAVSSRANKRTLICTITPPAFHGSSVISIRVFDDAGNRIISNSMQLFACGILNSFVVDWLMRTKDGIQVLRSDLLELPIPRYLEQDTTCQQIVQRTAELICYSSEFAELASEVGLGSHDSWVTDPVERAQLRAELDGLVAHIYGLTEEEFAHILSTFPLVEDDVKEAAQQAYRRFAPDPEIMPLILAGESVSVEFKTAAAYNPYTGKHDNAMRNQISEAVAAFMNASGGALLIGVADDGTVVGINQEYMAVNPSKANWDGYALFLADVLDKSLSLAAAARFYSISRHSVNGLDIARIQVQPASEPVYVNNKLFVRQGARSIEQQGPNLISYVQSRWPGYRPT